MRILVLHAWLKGNLGDVLQLSVLLSALRELKPRVLDLAGHPAQPAGATAEVLRLADRYLPDTFPWYWKLSPPAVGRAVLEPWWRARRRAFFARYDAIVCAPGPYLADYDARVTSALCDIDVAADLGRPLVLSSHSIGPLQSDGLAEVGRATVRIAREPATLDYLTERGIPAVSSADYAFLYPYGGIQGHEPIPPPYRLVFLRSNNLDGDRLKLENGALFDGLHQIAEPGDPLVLATSDVRRDGRFLARAAGSLGVRWVACRSIEELVLLMRPASSVVSDRYHPAICAAALGRPAQVLLNREPHKMQGLKRLLAEHPLEELQELARAGLRAVQDALRGCR
ncbi:MAG TPA: polysaccharide pyruvyl transferase family protein [Vicinamibacterales bacterium]|nr:polysaccharide pyruvyl transferase family protein [Vicinamibacterales bacterium]